MAAKGFLLTILIGSSLAFPVETREDDPIASAIAAANVPKYVAPTTASSDITDWLAIGDSFSAGISADVPSDELEYWCSRFKQSYPNQMNNDPRFPGHSTSRTFVFGACSGAKMQDVLNKQIELGDPNLSDQYPKIGKPQIGTLSLSGNDLGFGDIVNACLYHWIGYKDCTQMLSDAHAKLDDPRKAFESQLVETIGQILRRAKAANESFQLYITGYIQFWNDQNPQCNTVSWAPWYKAAAYQTIALRSDMNSLVDGINALLQRVAEYWNHSLGGGVFYVDGFQQKFDTHRFCEVEDDPSYHKKPIGDRTWFIHWNSPYANPSSVTGLGAGSFFDQVDSILIPEKDGKSTEDQIREVDGDLAKINPAYNNTDSMTAALIELARGNPKYIPLPVTWTRIMHPKGSGYKPMSDAVIDAVLRYGPTTTNGNGGGGGGGSGLKCATGANGNNKFISRNDLNNQIGTFCGDAAQQGVQDKDSGSIVRTYNQGQRYEVILSMDWPSSEDIKQDMKQNCIDALTVIMDDCDGNDPKNPLDWKHGGTNGVGNILYHIIPSTDQGYTPGNCTFHLQEDESWTGVDSPGFERHWDFRLEKLTLDDGAGATIGTSPAGSPIEAGDGNSFSWKTKLPDPLFMTPEAQGNPKDYIQFNMGSQSWVSSDTDKTKMPFCNVGGFSSQYSPDNRNMDCWFNC